MIWTILIIIGSIYLLFSIFVYFMSNSNLVPKKKRQNYTIGFGAELRRTPSIIDPKLSLAYWVADQGGDKSVILLHGFTRTSKRLEVRAEIYWDMGYNLYFVDNLGHGYSSNLLYPSGYRYGIEIAALIEKEGIDQPVLHGLSMGAIAASILTQTRPELVRALVAEALPIDFKNLYGQFLGYIHIPAALFPWIEWVSRKFNWKQFDKLGVTEEDYRPWEVECPFLLIHSDADRLFDYRDHFIPISKRVQNNPNFKAWLAQDSGHTRMMNHPEYRNRVEEFLSGVSDDLT
ncbi:MAG: alpha/beta fold hydrolase [Candidatus Kariarchaeaceae archaeon]|jgi:pimeloyl-ACP methyl ester carboxylesterase